MRTLSDATAAYLRRPSDKRFVHDCVHITVTKSLKQTLTHFICDFYNPDPYAPGQRRLPCNSTQRWLAQFPEGKQIVSKTYDSVKFEFPITDMVVERIAACIPKENISFEDVETEVRYNEVLLRGIQADHASQIYSDFKIKGKIPEHDLVHSSEYPLTGYQQVGLYNSLNSDAYGLFMEQGTGKTPIGIAMICNEAEEHYEKHGTMYRAIIVCPKQVRTNWANEFKKFATTKGKITILHGGWFERTRQIVDSLIEQDGCKFSTIICSYDAMRLSMRAFKFISDNMCKVGWDLAMLDEGHSIKSVLAKRTAAAMQLRDMCKRRSILTGTPITNTALDLYTQLEFLGEGYSGFYSFKAFKRFFARHRMDVATGREVYDGLQNVPFMQERLARYSFRVLAEEVQKDLPDRVYDTVEVDMTTEQQSIYERVRDEMVLEIQASLERAENKSMIVNSSLTRLLKLTEITAGFVSFSQVLDNESGEVIQPASVDRLDPDPKLEELVDILKAKGPNDKTIVWSCWVQNIKTISARLKEEGIQNVIFYGGTSEDKRIEAEYSFNCDPDCKVFIGNPAAGGTGLNLIGYPPEGHEIYERLGKTPDDWETNCNHVIYYSQDWSMVKRSQSEKRAHRRGTRAPVRVTDLVVPNTVDTEIREAVLDKTRNALEIGDLRRILERLSTMELMND